MQLLNEKCCEVSGHGEERSHYQPNRVRNSVVKNEFAKPGLSWQKGSLVMKSLLKLMDQSVSFLRAGNHEDAKQSTMEAANVNALVIKFTREKELAI